MATMDIETLKTEYEELRRGMETLLSALEEKSGEYKTLLEAEGFTHMPLFFREMVARDMAEADRRLMRMRLLRERLSVMAGIIDDYKTLKR